MLLYKDCAPVSLPLSFAQVRVGLRCYYACIFDDKLDENTALLSTVKKTGISKPVLAECIKEWECKKNIRCVDGSNRCFGRKGKGKAPAGTSTYLKQYVDRQNELGRSVTAVECHRYLASEPSDTADPEEAFRIPVRVSRQTVCTWLHQIGYGYKEAKKGFTPTEARKARVREYLIDLSKALKEEKDDRAVLVFMDESYCHVNHCRTTSWFGKGETRVNTKSKGGRVIIVHAISRDGPLVADSCRDEKGFPLREGWFSKDDGRQREGSSSRGPSRGAGGGPSGDAPGCRVVIAEQAIAEMLFPAGDKKEADYHKNMDADVFMKWLEKRLLPAYRAKHGEKKIILILDNAPYHHGMADDSNSPLKASKTVNEKLLRDLSVETITIDRKGQPTVFAVPKEGEHFPRAPRGPSLDEVREATFRIVKKLRPDDLLTRAERFFKEKIGDLLYTPPYCPEFQPMELFWAHAKGYVASMWEGRGRNMPETVNLLRFGFYGKKRADGTWEAAPPDCGKLVRHSMDCAEKAVERDAVLKGTLADLQNVPAQYKVSKEAGLDELEDEEMDLCEADAE